MHEIQRISALNELVIPDGFEKKCAGLIGGRFPRKVCSEPARDMSEESRLHAGAGAPDIHRDAMPIYAVGP
jgi:hypothetical protein